MTHSDALVPLMENEHRRDERDAGRERERDLQGMEVSRAALQQAKLSQVIFGSQQTCA